MTKARDIADGTRYVDVTGDTMTGTLAVAGTNKGVDFYRDDLARYGSVYYDGQELVIRQPTGDNLVVKSFAGTDLFRVTGGGLVSNPTLPTFRASRTTNFSTNNNTVIIVYNNTYHNNGGYYSTGNGRFTAPLNGYYMFGASLQPTNSGQNTRINFKVNGTSLPYSLQGWTSLPSRGDISINTALYMNQNDYIQVEATSSSSCVWDNHGIFYGFMVG